MAKELLRMDHITKTFPGVKALDNVNVGMYFASEPAEEAKVKEEIQKHLNKIK